MKKEVLGATFNEADKLNSLKESMAEADRPLEAALAEEDREEREDHLEESPDETLHEMIKKQILVALKKRSE